MSLATLLHAARAVPEPLSYYSGTAPPSLLPPANVILFHRSRSSAMGTGRAAHHRFVLILNCRTAGTVIVDTHALRLAPGEALLIHPHQFHHYLGIEHKTTDWLFVTFEHPEAEQLLDLRGMPLDMDSGVLRSAAHLAQAWANRDRAGVSDATVCFLCATLLSQLLDTARRPLPAHRPAPGNPILESVHRFVSANLGQSFAVSDCARAAGLSESRLRAVYREATGMSLGRYVAQLRLNRATGLLRRSRMRVKEIAAECGYESLFSFSRAFRREFGLSPRSYRNQTTC